MTLRESPCVGVQLLVAIAAAAVGLVLLVVVVVAGPLAAFVDVVLWIRRRARSSRCFRSLPRRARP
jgi:type IV secretory pathway VirB3-like protein